MFVGYIYRFYNKITQKSYIGQTIRPLNERVKEHLKASKYSDKNYFHSALRKYGIENFDISILHTVDGKTKEGLINKLNLLEVKEIEKHNSYLDGYNSNTGGKNYIVSDEAKRKMSASRKGVPLTEQHKLALSKAKKGKKSKPRSAEYIEKLRQRMKNTDTSRLHTPEARQKAINKIKGQKRTDEIKKKMSKALKNKFVSEETKEKIRKANLGKKHSIETIEKLKTIAQEKAKNQEYIKKLSESVRKSWIKRKEEMKKNKEDNNTKMKGVL